MTRSITNSTNITSQTKYKFPEAHELCKEFVLSKKVMNEVIERLTKEIKLGLAKATHDKATVKCFVTYVQDFPSGQERGKYLALDLGGTNFRVLMIELKSQTDVKIISKSFGISKELMTGPGQMLFDFIAECLSKFCTEHNVDKKKEIPLGFTFSFPLMQQGLDRGILKVWTKGFICSGVVGQDVVQLLDEAIQRRNEIKIKIVAIINDTVGTLMACAFYKCNCRIGLIVGTGTNACYVEKTQNAEMFEANHERTPGGKEHMIINSEWGAFGDNGVIDFLRTPFDKQVDEGSHNPGRQIYEKCISGLFLGELVRLILVDLMQKGAIFANQESHSIQEKGKFLTRFVSEIETDISGAFDYTDCVLNEIGIRNASDKDKACLRYICQAVSTRAAQLTACGLVCLINKMDVKDVAIAIDGSVYRHHPRFHDMLYINMKRLLQKDIEFQLILSEDGSGRGAALIAAAATNSKMNSK
ncbi:uncharacterized protein Dwil_GK19144 [Drosophila willistoni]|uniref:Phosphotransferase n=2 Tax=Drosophila willistoni TaxID=7260 RepID=B4N456_DROWI|nr:uncharacterized protein Dwil_GK19144 [Drosophila willistoni]